MRACLGLALLVILLACGQTDRSKAPATQAPRRNPSVGAWTWHPIGGLAVVEGEVNEPTELILEGPSIRERRFAEFGPVRWEFFRPPAGEGAVLRTADGRELARFTFSLTPPAHLEAPSPRQARRPEPSVTGAPAPMPVVKPIPEPPAPKAIVEARLRNLPVTPIPARKPQARPSVSSVPSEIPRRAAAANPYRLEFVPPPAVKPATPAPLPPKPSPAPAPLHPKPSPVPAPVPPKPSPVPAPLPPKPSPALASILPKPSPAPAPLPPKPSPAPASLLPKPSPVPASILPKPNPVPASILPKPNPTPAPLLPKPSSVPAPIPPRPATVTPPALIAAGPVLPVTPSTGMVGTWPGGGEALNLTRGPGGHKRILLSFDGGSSAEVATEVLDLLKARGVHTTLFLTGAFIQRFPALVKRMAADGHELGNHTMNHPHFAPGMKRDPKWTRERIQRELLDADAALVRLLGRPMDPFWRAPYGEHTAEIRRWAEELGYRHVGWSEGADTLDWATAKDRRLYRSGEAIVARLQTRLGRDGDGLIVLMHLGSARELGDRPTDGLGAFMDRARQEGWTFVTAGALLRDLGKPAWDPQQRIALLNGTAPRTR